MRRLFLILAALGLLGAVGCHHDGPSHWRGRCDCDDTWGCGCCPGYTHPDNHIVDAAPGGVPEAIPTTITPIKQGEPIPAPTK